MFKTGMTTGDFWRVVNPLPTAIDTGFLNSRFKMQLLLTFFRLFCKVFLIDLEKLRA